MRDWWWLWSRCPGLGSRRMQALRTSAAAHGLGLDELWSCPPERLRQILPWSGALLTQIEAYRQTCGTRPDRTVPDNVLLPLDNTWPTSLDALEQPPLALFHQGQLELLQCLSYRKAVAVVGTRSASSHGLGMAEDLGRVLAGAGWPVLSGLAEGIDGAVHRGCLQGGGAPVAVLGTPLDRSYPRHHDTLQTKVGESGLLLTELPPGTTVQRRHFAARNRLVAAFAGAVVVVECPERSGALITAHLAAERHCPVWAVPGDARRWSARGSNALLLGQATPVLSPEALVNQLEQGPLKPGVKQQDTAKIRPSSPDQTALLQAVGEGATLQELCTCLGHSSDVLALNLLELELAGHVLCESGNRWRALHG